MKRRKILVDSQPVTVSQKPPRSSKRVLAVGAVVIAFSLSVPTLGFWTKCELTAFTSQDPCESTASPPEDCSQVLWTCKRYAWSEKDCVSGAGWCTPGTDSTPVTVTVQIRACSPRTIQGGVACDCTSGGELQSTYTYTGYVEECL